MKRFSCPCCSSEVYFDSSDCISCQSQLGYLAASNMMLATPADASGWTWEGRSLLRCGNYQAIGCNWLIEPEEPSGLCRSCSFTHTIPDLSVEGNGQRWSRLEGAKRALFYSIDRFGLPPHKKSSDDNSGLWFDFKADELTTAGNTESVLTGHDRGQITLNIAESDDAEREKRRTGMGEPYRTLIGHFRHEIGHYYWDQLVANSDNLDGFRRLFGDERVDYSSALDAHYRNGAPANWALHYVSAYATAHPWEDFAETWAHAFHIVDGLETAEAYGIAVQDDQHKAVTSPYAVSSVEQLFAEWVPVTVAMNAMNRSIGQPDFYPFVLSEAIVEKLQFVLDVIHAPRQPG